MPAPSSSSELSRSQEIFQAATPELREMVKKIVGFERQVQHMKNRVLPGADGLGIHQALLVQIRTTVK